MPWTPGSPRLSIRARGQVSLKPLVPLSSTRPSTRVWVGGSRLMVSLRLSASVMDGVRLRIGAVYNAEQVAQPSRLAAALVERGDRNFDALGRRGLREELGFEPTDVRTSANIARWEALLAGVDVLDRERNWRRGRVGSEGGGHPSRRPRGVSAARGAASWHCRCGGVGCRWSALGCDVNRRAGA